MASPSSTFCSTSFKCANATLLGITGFVGLRSPCNQNPHSKTRGCSITSAPTCCLPHCNKATTSTPSTSRSSITTWLPQWSQLGTHPWLAVVEDGQKFSCKHHFRRHVNYNIGHLSKHTQTDPLKHPFNSKHGQWSNLSTLPATSMVVSILRWAEMIRLIVWEHSLSLCTNTLLNNSTYLSLSNESSIPLNASSLDRH